MGAAISAVSALCCACQCCSTMASCLRCAKSSTRARVQYFTMFVLVAFFSWILKDYGYDGLKRVGDMKNCNDATCTGRGIVLRMSLAMVFVSSALCLLLFGVENSKDPRAVIQNDFFVVKWLVLAITVVAMMFFPNANTIEYGYVAAVGGGIFLLIGVLLVLEFAYGWNDAWVQKYDDSNNNKWGVLIVATATVLYAASVVVWVLLLVHFGGKGCDHTTAFVTVTIIVSVLVTILTLPDKVTQGAILPCSVIVLYCTWLCASAVLSIPVDNEHECEARHSDVSSSTAAWMRVVGVLFTIFCVGYATIRAGSSGQDLSGAQPNVEASLVDKEQSEVKMEAEEDEEDNVQYDYSFFQFVYALGAMYLAMVLIDWQIKFDEDNGKQLGSMSEWANVWIKIATQWATFGLYVWTLIAPLVCTSRDFS